METEQAALIDETEGILATPETEEVSTEAEEAQPQEEEKFDPDKYVPIDRFNKVYGRMKHYERQLGTPAPTQQETQQPSNDGKPNPDDFETHEDYVKSLVKFELKQQETQSRQEAQKHEQLKRQQEFDKRMAKGYQKYEDFEDVTYMNSEVFNTPESQKIIDVMQDFENPADLAYYLGKHPQEESRLSQLSLVGIARELTRIEAELSKTPTRTTSKAPEPVNPVGSTEKPVKKLEDMSMSEYIAYMNKKEFGK